MINLEQYHIDFADHITDVATEGFFADDKNPRTLTKDIAGTGVWETINYKRVSIMVPGPNWAKVYVNNLERTTDTFKTKGIALLKKWLQEIANAEQFVKANGGAFRQAVATNNVEVLSNLSEGLKKCLPELIAANRASYNRINQFNGEIVVADEAFKKQLLEVLESFQKIYREVAVLLSNKYIEEHESKSTLKKTFRHTLLDYNKNYYLEKELYVFCKDLHAQIDDINI